MNTVSQRPQSFTVAFVVLAVLIRAVVLAQIFPSAEVLVCDRVSTTASSTTEDCQPKLLLDVLITDTAAQWETDFELSQGQNCFPRRFPFLSLVGSSRRFAAHSHAHSPNRIFLRLMLATLRFRSI